MKKALIVVDVQNDFCPGGLLEVPKGDKIIPVINKLLPLFEIVIFTKDWHPADHKSFASQHPGKKVFDVIDLNGIDQILWPDHCIQNTPGADIHKKINFALIKDYFYIFKKGSNPEVDSYSGFYDNDKKTSTGLKEFLKRKKVKEVYVCGLATDYCVLYTAMDAAKEKFNTVVIKDASRGITKNLKEVYKKLTNNKINLIKSKKLFK